MTSASDAICLRAAPATFPAHAQMRSPARLWSAALFLLLLGRAAGDLPSIQASCPKSGKRLSRQRTTRAVRSSTHVEGCGHRSVPAVANGRLRWAGERAISCRHHHHGKACLEHALLGRRSRRSGSLAAIILTRCRSDAREAMRGQISLPWRRGPHLRPRRRHSPLSVKFKYPTASPGQRHSARSPRGS